VDSNQAGCVAREFCTKNVTTCDFDKDEQALVGGGLPRLKKFAIFLGSCQFKFCQVFFFCQGLSQHSAKALISARQKALGKELFAV
jgi:hypothetical protein